MKLRNLEKILLGYPSPNSYYTFSHIITVTRKNLKTKIGVSLEKPSRYQEKGEMKFSRTKIVSGNIECQVPTFVEHVPYDESREL